jgi:hypothetical protein
MKSQDELLKELDNARECLRTLTARLGEAIQGRNWEMARQYSADLVNLGATLDTIAFGLGESARNL